MVMMENDDELLKQFFAQHTVQRQDDDFTRRVMRKLPRRHVSLNRIWVTCCMLAGVAILVFGNALNQLRMVLTNIVGDISGLLASMELGATSPIMIYLAVLTLVSVGAYNVMTSE